MEIVLASASTRRKELLEKIGLRFTVDPSGYPEDTCSNLKPRERARQVALEKARAVAARHNTALIISADTFGMLGGQVLGKPQSPDEARAMLRTLNGHAHIVITGFAVLDAASSRVITRAVETKVFMRKLSKREIDSYVSSGEPMDKAGAYAIQGLGSVLIDRIEGDYYNVVGLPLSVLTRVLKNFGVRIL